MKAKLFYSLLFSVAALVAMPVMAQEEYGYKKINVVEDFSDNGFQWFRDAQLLASGNREKSEVTNAWKK